MLKIKMTHKMLSRREYDRMPWELRGAHTHAMRTLFREELVKHPKREYPAAVIVLSSGTVHCPENWHLSPIFSALRSGMWIDEKSRVLLVRSEDRDDLEITLEYGE